MSRNHDEHWRESRWNRAMREIRRLPSEGVCAGVLAGLGDYMDWNPRILRVIAVLLFIFVMGPLALCLYALAWYLIDPAAGPGYHSSGSSPSGSPKRPSGNGSSNLRGRFVQIEKRLRNLEAVVTSNEFHLQREFDRLEKGH